MAGRVLIDVMHGREAATALLLAFLSARGRFHVTISSGTTKRRDKILVVVEFTNRTAVFTPPELLGLGRKLLAGIPDARTLGASERDVDTVRNFATFLIRNAEEAAVISPHGLN